MEPIRMRFDQGDLGTRCEKSIDGVEDYRRRKSGSHLDYSGRCGFSQKAVKENGVGIGKDTLSVVVAEFLAWPFRKGNISVESRKRFQNFKLFLMIESDSFQVKFI